MEDIMDNEYISITEASILTGKHITTIYKGIRLGRIQYKTVEDKSKTVKKVLKSDILKLYISEYKTVLDEGIRPSNTQVEDRIRLSKDDMKQAIEEVLEAKQSQLMKPLEQQALYKLGSVEKENIFLRERLETLRQENELLSEQVKMLPGPAELETKENIILLLQKEKEDLNTIQKEYYTRHMAEQQKHIHEMEEKEQKIKDLCDLHQAELEQALKQAEEKQMEISEAWKKELEEAKKPWWKLW
jgi:hypothetical protein